MKQVQMMHGHRLRRQLRVAGLAGVLVLAGGVHSARAATQLVRMVNFAFVPQSVTIHVGDTVLWTNTTGTAHTTTSDRGLWDSGLFTAPGTFAVTFRNAGSFGYFCIPHRSAGMVGTVTVLGPNRPPSVSITSPADHAVLPAPATFALQATATDPDGTVANVKFFLDGGLVGQATTAPYGVTVHSVAAGTYVLTATASDNAGLTATSAPVRIKVDVPPSVALTDPAPNAHFLAPATFAVQASASDPDGSVTNVRFFVNGVLAGKRTTAPYAVTLSNVAAGTYLLTTKARDDVGLVGRSAPLTIKVDAPPSVTITSPAPNAVFPAPATFTVRAAATDPDGAVANVRFFVNGALAGKATTVPYGITVSNLAVGSYALTAVARDNGGLLATSAPVTLKVDQPPSVVLTSPASNAVFAAPATVTIQASATDSDGSVTNVRFFVNGTLAGKATTVPYSVTVSNLAAGTYVLTAKARDDAGLVGRSAPVTIKVRARSTASATPEVATGPALSTVVADGAAEIIRFDPNSRVVGGQVRLTLSVVPGRRYALEASSTLTQWTTLTNFAAVSNAFSFASPIMGIPQRFFRARLLPSP